MGCVSVTFHRQDGTDTRETEPGGVRGSVRINPAFGACRNLSAERKEPSAERDIGSVDRAAGVESQERER